MAHRWGAAFAFAFAFDPLLLRRLLGSGGGARCYPASTQHQYEMKVGIAEFLRGIGRGVEGHVAKLEAQLGGDLHTLLQTRTLRLKKLEIPCKHRKLILNYAQKYRLGLWRPPAHPPKP